MVLKELHKFDKEAHESFLKEVCFSLTSVCLSQSLFFYICSLSLLHCDEVSTTVLNGTISLIP